MGVISEYIPVLESDLKEKKRLNNLLIKLKDKEKELEKSYEIYLEAQQLLSSISDKNTQEALDYVTGIINKVLGEMFDNERFIYLEKKLFNNKYPHINVILETSDGTRRDLALQSGNGLRQVVSFLFTICLIEIRKGRRLLMMDEILNGVHPDAMEVIRDIIEIFAKKGFQFIIIEYNMEEMGKVYSVEKQGSTADVLPL